jgi:hypothetical protein
MTTDDQRPRDDDRPIDGGERKRLDELPEHEIDDDQTVGGGVMSEGGTAIDRGTGTLAGQAQGEGEKDRGSEQDPDFLADEADAALGHDQRAIR